MRFIQTDQLLLNFFLSKKLKKDSLIKYDLKSSIDDRVWKKIVEKNSETMSFQCKNKVKIKNLKQKASLEKEIIKSFA